MIEMILIQPVGACLVAIGLGNHLKLTLTCSLYKYVHVYNDELQEDFDVSLTKLMIFEGLAGSASGEDAWALDF